MAESGCIQYSRLELLDLRHRPCCRRPPPALVAHARALAAPALLPPLPQIQQLKVEKENDEVEENDGWEILNRKETDGEASEEIAGGLCRDVDPGKMEKMLKLLVEQVELTRDEVDSLEETLEGLAEVIGSKFPGSKLLPYGSAASGLAIHGSDLDLFVRLGPGQQASRGAIRQVASLLRRDVSLRYTGALAIMANTPIVRVTDSLTGVLCDINLTNQMGVHNTAYIRYCTEVDPRARDLMVVVKVFCRRHGITTNPRGGNLNNYSLAIMVIFYLQTRGILHPLHLLQEVPGLEELSIGGYNFAFCQDTALLPPLRLTTSTVVQLLRGFLDYFANFPFSTHALCPTAGEEVALRDQQEVTNLHSRSGNIPDRLGPLVILDPFELSRNVAHAVSAVCLGSMVEVFGKGARVLQVSMEGTTSQHQLFHMLFQHHFTDFNQAFKASPVFDNLLMSHQQEREAEGVEEVVVEREAEEAEAVVVKDLGWSWGW